jgi:NADPH-dependent 2,4-dienoyl-CoA reductase/sulfur reductase-like enzyme
MKKVDVLVIGGCCAGITAATSCRRLYPQKNVTLIRREEKPLGACGIPFMVATIGSPDRTVFPDFLVVNRGTELMIGKVEKINRDNKTVLLADGNTIGYEKLVLATGSSPVAPPIPGIEKENVFMVEKDVPYLKKMLDAINAAKDIVVIGGGFIGIEFAEECKKHHDCNVTIVEMLPHCLQLNFDEEFCVEAEKVITEMGIKLLTNNKVESIIGDKQVNSIRLSDGKELKTDVLIISVGFKPDIKLAQEAGLQIGPTEAIAVDRYMRTTDRNIFACGDCAEKYSFFSGKPASALLASVAGTEGRIAGANLFNTSCINCGTIGTFSFIIGERSFSSVGLTEAAAKEEGYDLVVSEETGMDKFPPSIPEATKIKVKLVFSKQDGLLLGGEISGGWLIGEPTNVISACIQARMTAYDITLFQMSSSPKLTASPSEYQIVNAAELAVKKIRAG